MELKIATLNKTNRVAFSLELNFFIDLIGE